jgi:hypothetical protein
MNGANRFPPTGGVQPALPISPYALEVSVGGSFEGRYRLRWDKPTWTGRRPHQSYDDYEYIQIPGSRIRYHCLFEWDAKGGDFGSPPGARRAFGSTQKTWAGGSDVCSVKATCSSCRERIEARAVCELR